MEGLRRMQPMSGGSSAGQYACPVILCFVRNFFAGWVSSCRLVAQVKERHDHHRVDALNASMI